MKVTPELNSKDCNWISIHKKAHLDNQTS
ncbi:unnamed protein product, partial [Vitis vinifera]|uniref:Uncharacterized protein n=1 Tax=Vitis vinifera TaxID=29760 RepID=D7TDN9_VITVI